MTDELERLRAVLEAATPGPWEVDRTDTGCLVPTADPGEPIIWTANVTYGGPADALGRADDDDDQAEADMRAIAALGTLWPALLAVAEAAVAHLDDEGILCSVSGDPLRWRMCGLCAVEVDHEGWEVAEHGPLPAFPHGIDCPVDALRAAIREHLGEES